MKKTTEPKNYGDVIRHVITEADNFIGDKSIEEIMNLEIYYKDSNSQSSKRQCLTVKDLLHCFVHNMLRNQKVTGEGENYPRGLHNNMQSITTEVVGNELRIDFTRKDSKSYQESMKKAMSELNWLD